MRCKLTGITSLTASRSLNRQRPTTCSTCRFSKIKARLPRLVSSMTPSFPHQTWEGQCLHITRRTRSRLSCSSRLTSSSRMEVTRSPRTPTSASSTERTPMASRARGAASAFLVQQLPTAKATLLPKTTPLTANADKKMS